MTQPSANDEPSEISLRDLYLILRRGLPLIIVAALIAAAITFIYSSLQDPVYEAESTTIITLPPIDVQGRDNIRFMPSVTVSYEAYETLALSRPVMETTLARFADPDLTLSGLRSASNLEMLIGPQRPGEVAPLSVSHQVRHTDPEMAAAISNAWTEITLETVRSSFLAGLDPVDAATAAETETLLMRLEEAEAAWEAFQEDNRIALLESRIEALSAQIAEAEGEFVPLSELAALPSTELLNVPRVNLEQEIAANEAILESLRAQADAQELEEVRYREALLNSLQARRELLGRQLERFESRLESTLAELAQLGRRQGELARELENARTAYQDVARLRPTIAYVTQLAPLSANILSEASAPDEPVGPRRLLNTLLAFVLGGILATLYVFLREAVAGPGGEAAGARGRGRRASLRSPAGSD